MDCCTVCTPPFSCRRPRRPPRPQVLLLDRDVGGRKDEALGEVFIPIASFKEPKVVFHGSPSEAVRFGSGRCHRLSICIRVFSPLEADQFGSVWLGSARFGSVRFGSVRFRSALGLVCFTWLHSGSVPSRQRGPSQCDAMSSAQAQGPSSKEGVR